MINSQLLNNDGLGNIYQIWEMHLNSKPKQLFFYQAILKAVDSCLAQEYTKFDGHTTTNCCHGIALLVKNLILSVLNQDLKSTRRFICEKIQEIEVNFSTKEGVDKSIPHTLLLLTSLYILAITREINSEKRMRTEAKKLREIAYVGVEFCWTITNALKKYFSNLVAHSYQFYLNEIPPSAAINGVSACTWGNYVSLTHLRIDKREIYYASCVFSTQIVLLHLIFYGAKIALVNDIINSNNDLLERYICVLQGDKKANFIILSDSELNSSNHNEPVIVFAGYVHSNTLNIQSLSLKLAPWLSYFPSLMLACDVVYPQFPSVPDDSQFDKSPIIPKEENLKRILYNHATISGVSASDPSLYCSSHTYCASLGQVLNDQKKKAVFSLPCCFQGLKISPSEMWGREIKHLLPFSQEMNLYQTINNG